MGIDPVANPAAGGSGYEPDGVTIGLNGADELEYIGPETFVPGAADGRIPFSTTGPTMTDSGNFKWDEVNKRITGTGSTYVQISTLGGSILAYDSANYISHNGSFARVSSQVGGLLVSGTSQLANLGVDNGNDFGTTPTGRGCFGLGTAVAPGTVGNGNGVFYLDPTSHCFCVKGANGVQTLSAALW